MRANRYQSWQYYTGDRCLVHRRTGYSRDEVPPSHGATPSSREVACHNGRRPRNVRFNRCLSPQDFRIASPSGGYGALIAPSTEMSVLSFMLRIRAGAPASMFFSLGARYIPTEVYYRHSVHLVMRFRPSRIEWLLQARTASFRTSRLVVAFLMV